MTDAPHNATATRHPRNGVTWLRHAAMAEGVSYLLLLFVAMPLKYFADMPIYVRYTGMLHGLLFILVVLLLFVVASRVPVKWLVITFVGTLIPFGPFVIDKHLKRFEASEIKAS